MLDFRIASLLGLFGFVLLSYLKHFESSFESENSLNSKSECGCSSRRLQRWHLCHLCKICGKCVGERKGWGKSGGPCFKTCSNSWSLFEHQRETLTLLGCVVFKGMGYFWANWNSHRVISVGNLLKLEVHQKQHQKWGIMFHQDDNWG